MSKVAPALLLAAFSVLTAGCHMLPPGPQNDGAAMKTYQSHIAETCPAKHKENLSVEQLQDIEKDYYQGLDLNSRQRVDYMQRRSCGFAGAHQPDCAVAGFLAGVQNVGVSNDFATFVCAQPSGEGQGHEGASAGE